MKYIAYVWDFDGTLLDTYPAITNSLQQALAFYGHHPEKEEVFRMCKITLPAAIEHYASLYNLDKTAVMDKYLQAYPDFPIKKTPPFAGVETFIEQSIAQGAQHYIITHRPLDSVLRHLDYYHMSHWFKRMITSDDNYSRKPSPEAFIALRDIENLSAHSTLAIGDRDIDILAAKGAGFATCLYDNADRSIKADIYIKHYAQLSAMLLT